jgi:cell division initiation protein
LRISPLDVRSQEFKRSLRGYDPEEVKAFLESIADTMEEILKEKELAESELIALKKQVETFTAMEISLRDAMVAAQKAGDEARVNARRNSELMLREAELDVRQRIADAKRKVDDIFRARETVRAEMRAFLPRLRSLLESQLTYLENIEEEVAGMELGEAGDDMEAKEVKSFTQAMESRAKEAEATALDETVAEKEKEVKRREAAVAGAAGQPDRRGEGQQSPGQGEQDPLDVAMHQHHQRQAGAPQGQAAQNPPEQKQQHQAQGQPQQGQQQQPQAQGQPQQGQQQQPQQGQEQQHQEPQEQPWGYQAQGQPQQGQEQQHQAQGQPQQHQAQGQQGPVNSPWTPAPQEQNESEKREDVNA